MVKTECSVRYFCWLVASMRTARRKINEAQYFIFMLEIMRIKNHDALHSPIPINNHSDQ
jgi:hypothetical protein